MFRIRRQSIFAFLLFIPLCAFAQQDKRPKFSHALTYTAPSQFRSKHAVSVQAFPETLRVLVAMVEFQPDNTPYTSGKGYFDSSASTKIIDPPPHNKMYFQNHLTFVENYFRKVSNGKLVVQDSVLDNVYSVPNQMPHYSPSRTSSDNIELGRLMQDAWHVVDSLDSVRYAANPSVPRIPFNNFQAFVIFHAGVGRDIDMTSLYGYDPTPLDIPSIYLNLSSLKKMFGNACQGVPVSGNSFFITNSMIIPETESRELQSIVGSFLLQLGINGLLAASIGSHLGLPDLFDTKTGATGIGRFGLMDGQSIFSWNGIFPPEPSAWEKYSLGWSTPITISSGDTVYNVPAVGLTATTDTIYRVLISEKEYFLVENRDRDAHRDGDTVSIWYNGSTVKKYWMRDTVGFNAYNQDSLYGVITDVDEFDISVPGGVNVKTGEYFDGGILIWHIDENVIDANVASNTVNANPERRGVNLMEADGAQDLGQSYGFGGPTITEPGWQFDFWFAGNSAPPRRLLNAFTPTSSPSSMSNDGANSHVYIKDFSSRAPRMTARIQAGDTVVQMLAGFPKSVIGAVQNRSVKIIDSISSIVVTTSSNIYGWNSAGNPLLPSFSSTGIIASTPLIGNGHVDFMGNISVADVNKDGTLDFVIGKNGFSTLSPSFQSLEAYSLKDVNSDSLADTLFENSLGQWLTTSPVVTDSFIAIGAKHGTVYLLSRSGVIIDSIQYGDTSDIVGLTLLRQPNVFLVTSTLGSVGIVPASGVILLNNFSKRLSANGITGIVSSVIGKRIAFASKDGYVYLVDSSLNVSAGFPASTGGEILNSPALADIDGDGSKDIIVFSGNKIWAINAVGSVLDNFPITVTTSKTILTSPIVADVDGNGTSDIVAVTQEGLVVAYDKTGKMVRGFPILSGMNGGSTPAAFYMPSPCLSCTDIGIVVASDDGHVYAWKTGTLPTLLPPKQPWPQYMHDAQSSGLEDSVLQINPRTTEFFPASRAYNWPNPVNAAHGYKTHIRYFIKQDARVHIKIFDLAGDLVTEFDGPGQGGFDNEIEWDVSAIQSGVYFAHIEAQGAGDNGVAIVKIAVVK